MKHRKPCPTCGGDVKRNDQYDAYFCDKCDQWTEGRCTDPECSYCVDRQENLRRTKTDQVKRRDSFGDDLGAALRWAYATYLLGCLRRSYWQKRLKMRWNKERFFRKMCARGDREYRVIVSRYRSRHNWYDQAFEQQENKFRTLIRTSMEEATKLSVDGVFISCEVSDE